MNLNINISFLWSFVCLLAQDAKQSTTWKTFCFNTNTNAHTHTYTVHTLWTVSSAPCVLCVDYKWTYTLLSTWIAAEQLFIKFILFLLLRCVATQVSVCVCISALRSLSDEFLNRNDRFPEQQQQQQQQKTNSFILSVECVSYLFDETTNASSSASLTVRECWLIR